jgi:hypothetical protein
VWRIALVWALSIGATSSNSVAGSIRPLFPAWSDRVTTPAQEDFSVACFSLAFDDRDIGGAFVRHVRNS